MDRIFNEDCLVTMERAELKNNVDLIITSPPYNVSRVGVSDVYNARYDLFEDLREDNEYIEWIVNVFHGYDKVLKENGVVCFNLSYSSENTQLIWLTVAEIIKKTSFTTADCIVWKKKNAIPNNRSKNKLTRIVEFVFIFVRKNELKTFNCNKKITSVIERTGQPNYENIFNFIEAKNNDGSNHLNKATFSTDFASRLLALYGKEGDLVYDSFMGIGTTAKACMILNMHYVGSEISQQQIDYFNQNK